MNFILFDGQHHQKLKPLTLTRPVSDLRVGLFKIHEKWSNFLGSEVGVRSKDYLADKFSSNKAQADIGISGALLPSKEICEAIEDLEDNTIMIKDGKVLAIKPLPKEDDEMEGKLNGYRVLKYSGDVQMIDRPMDIFLLNGDQILSDLKFVNTEKLSTNDYGQGNLIIGNEVFIEKGAVLNGVTLNSSLGPIYIGENTEIMEGSNIRGPFALMEGSTIKMGAKIYGPTTIGPHCKIGGELGNVVFQGYANKAHDGFLGNSVIGHWCNLGADTNTSNLKNNYSEVKSHSYVSESLEPTGTKYCGLIIGDHSKSGINTMFNTGSVVGAFVNVFDSGFPPKFIPSFSWGGKNGFVDYEFEKAMEVAKVVMDRRGVDLDSITTKLYEKLYDLTKS
jgi:UDP-N-acetylglucosamine diphosphorylase/glucosamine-1-phosphate N-acetyltransferase